MNLIEEGINCMRQIAENDTVGEGIDEHWEAVLPETYDIMANEIFLTIHRRYISDSMKCWAAKVAQTLPSQDFGNIDDAKLYLHYLARSMWLGIAENPEFQAYVDGNVKGVFHTVRGIMYKPGLIGWAKSSRLWLPIPDQKLVQIAGALVERFKQFLFADDCWNQLTCNHVGKDVNKYMFALLTNSDVITQSDREEAYQGISDISTKATEGLEGIDPRDPMHDWLAKLSALPRHTQLMKIGATRKAIHDRAKDIQRKGGKYEHVSFEGDGEYADIIPDDSIVAPEFGIMGDEFLQLLLANQEKIEGLLSQDSPEKRRAKIGKRRFKVIQMLVHEPDLTSAEIAKRLKVGNQTIGRDRDLLRRCRTRIREVIYS